MMSDISRTNTTDPALGGPREIETLRADDRLRDALKKARAETFDEAAGIAIPAMPSDKTAFDGIERYRATLSLHAAYARAALARQGNE